MFRSLAAVPCANKSKRDVGSTALVLYSSTFLREDVCTVGTVVSLASRNLRFFFLFLIINLKSTTLAAAVLKLDTVYSMFSFHGDSHSYLLRPNTNKRIRHVSQYISYYDVVDPDRIPIGFRSVR